MKAELHIPIARHRAVRDLRQLGELLVAKTARVEESRVEELQLLLGDHSRAAVSKEVKRVVLPVKLSPAVDCVKEGLGIVLQPHGKVVHLPSSPHRLSPHLRLVVKIF